MEWLLFGSGALGAVGWILWLVARGKIANLQRLMDVCVAQSEAYRERAQRLESVKDSLRKELDNVLEAAAESPGRDSLRIILKRLLTKTNPSIQLVSKDPAT